MLARLRFLLAFEAEKEKACNGDQGSVRLRRGLFRAFSRTQKISKNQLSIFFLRFLRDSYLLKKMSLLSRTTP